MTPRDENLRLCLLDDTLRPPIEVELGLILTGIAEEAVGRDDEEWFDRYRSDRDFRGRVDAEREAELRQAERDFRDQVNIAKAAGL